MPHINPQSLVQSLTLCNSVKFKVSLLTFYSFTIFQFQGNVKCFWKVFCFCLCLSLSHPRHHHVLVVTLSSLLHIWTTTNFLFQLPYFSFTNFQRNTYGSANSSLFSAPCPCISLLKKKQNKTLVLSNSH